MKNMPTEKKNTSLEKSKLKLNQELEAKVAALGLILRDSGVISNSIVTRPNGILTQQQENKNTI